MKKILLLPIITIVFAFMGACTMKLDPQKVEYRTNEDYNSLIGADLIPPLHVTDATFVNGTIEVRSKFDTELSKEELVGLLDSLANKLPDRLVGETLYLMPAPNKYVNLTFSTEGLSTLYGDVKPQKLRTSYQYVSDTMGIELPKAELLYYEYYFPTASGTYYYKLQEPQPRAILDTILARVKRIYPASTGLFDDEGQLINIAFNDTIDDSPNKLSGLTVGLERPDADSLFHIIIGWAY